MLNCDSYDMKIMIVSLTVQYSKKFKDLLCYEQQKLNINIFVLKNAKRGKY